MATAVISGSEAMHYLAGLFEGLPIFWATIALMFFFVVLISFGINESSSVAIFISCCVYDE